MALGFPAGKAELDIRGGQLVLTLRSTLEDVQRFKAWLDQRSTADLQALGYDEDEAETLKAAFTDLDRLRLICNGQATQPEASDFMWNAKKLTGLQ